MSDEKKSIYELDFGELIVVHSGADFRTVVNRVPGGWVYLYFSRDGFSSTFVPFNNEFM